MSKICLCCAKELNNDESYWHKTCIKKMFNSNSIPEIRFDEDQIIEDNLNNGNVVSGVQKKFSLETNFFKSRKTISIANNKFIVKTQQENLNNIVYYEWLGMKLAKICKIDIVDCGIIKNNDELLYITKRVDRVGQKKIPMEDFCQLSNVQTEYKYNGSYERCYKNVIQKYSDYETIDKIKFYKIVLFSYIIGNTDMHLKNFSLYEVDGKYQMTPAYDLVPVLMVFNQQEMALTVNGKNKNLTKIDFYNFGLNMNIDEKIINHIHIDFLTYQDKMFDLIKKTNLSEIEKDKFVSLISSRIKMLCT